MTAIIWSIEITGRRGDPRTKFIVVWRLCLIGIGSGAAMIPYAMIKEANPHKVKGSAPVRSTSWCSASVPCSPRSSASP